jgi:hypothetical protein
MNEINEMNIWGGILSVPDIDNYIQEVSNGELILIPKEGNSQKNIIDYKNFNHNGMNLFEITLDLSKAIGINLFNDVKYDTLNKKGLLNGLPKHCNLYYIIHYVYGKDIPEWFAIKYNDVDKEQWQKYIEKTY